MCVLSVWIAYRGWLWLSYYYNLLQSVELYNWLLQLVWTVNSCHWSGWGHQTPVSTPVPVSTDLSHLLHTTPVLIRRKYFYVGVNTVNISCLVRISLSSAPNKTCIWKCEWVSTVLPCSECNVFWKWNYHSKAISTSAGIIFDCWNMCLSCMHHPWIMLQSFSQHLQSASV